MTILFQATYYGQLVTVGRATSDEMAVLMTNSVLTSAVDTLEQWSLIAIGGLDDGTVHIHALGWRAGCSRTCLTSRLVAADLDGKVVLTSSNHVYGLGRPNKPGRVQPDLLHHLDYTLRRWGFTDALWPSTSWSEE